SSTCVNFIRWFDPPMCQRYVQIIPGLLRSRNELEEILAIVEEKRLRLMKFFIISWAVMGYDVVDECRDTDHGFVHLEELGLLANSGKLRDQLIVYFDIKTQREVQLATEINNLTRQLVNSIDERCSFIQELERLPGNVMAYKTREELRGLQAMKMRTIAFSCTFRPSKGLTFIKLCKWEKVGLRVVFFAYGLFLLTFLSFCNVTMISSAIGEIFFKIKSFSSTMGKLPVSPTGDMF
ncbi:hypothetical protein Tco_1354148, partial [Tanacetum coccineum]